MNYTLCADITNIQQELSEDNDTRRAAAIT